MGIRPSELAAILASIKYGPTSTDSDVTAYISNVYAAGSSISQSAVDAITTFVAGRKAAGTWSNIVDMAVFMGPTTLAGALVKLKSGSGWPALANTSFVSGDYSRTGGMTGGTGKNLSFGKSVSSMSPISQNNAMVAAYVMSNDITGKAMISAGQYSSNPYFGIVSDLRATLNSSAYGVITSPSFPALLLATRSSSTQMVTRARGTERTTSAASAAMTSNNLFLFSNTTNSINFEGTLAGYMLGTYSYGTAVTTGRADWDTGWGTLISTLASL